MAKIVITPAVLERIKQALERADKTSENLRESRKMNWVCSCPSFCVLHTPLMHEIPNDDCFECDLYDLITASGEPENWCSNFGKLLKGNKPCQKCLDSRIDKEAE
jgi:hypothetical protein